MKPLKKTLTVRASAILIGIVVARVAVRLLRKWLGDDFLSADTASMIVTTLDGLVVGGIAVAAMALRRAIMDVLAALLGKQSTVTVSVPSSQGAEPTTVTVTPPAPDVKP